jgi:predicted AlkP superfamily pyrophosphatase or phosphodiesterase
MAELPQGQTGEQELVTLVESDILDVEEPDLLAGAASSSSAPSDLHARARRCDQLQRRVVLALGLVFMTLGLALLFSFAPVRPPVVPAAPILVLVSIDGFRWDYLERGITPVLSGIANAGVRASSLVPSFPSKTFPNHYTLVTGLYPSAHGIVANNFFDPVFNASFSPAIPDCSTNARWWWGEPIWVTAIKAGKRAATMFWVGSQAAIEGVYPTYYRNYSQSVPYSDRVAQVLQWVGLPDTLRPSFLAVYFEGVDTAGHNFGPLSPLTNQAIQEVDTSLGYLVAGLNASGVPYDLVVLGDHGMTSVSTARVIRLADYIAPASVRLVDSGPIASIYPVGDVEATFQALQGRHPNMTVYLANGLPERYHFSDDRRIAPIVAVADLGWEIVLLAPSWSPAGDHGYDPVYTDMHTIFVARGPSFQRGLVMPSFVNTEVYALLCRVLRITPAPNNATQTTNLTSVMLVG